MARRSLHRDPVSALALLDARSACRRQGDSLAVLLSRLIAAMTDHRLDLLHVATSSETSAARIVAAIDALGECITSAPTRMVYSGRVVASMRTVSGLTATS